MTSRQLSPPKFEKINRGGLPTRCWGPVQIIMKKANATVQWIGIPEFLSRGIQHAWVIGGGDLMSLPGQP